MNELMSQEKYTKLTWTGSGEPQLYVLQGSKGSSACWPLHFNEQIVTRVPFTDNCSKTERTHARDSDDRKKILC
jgi:hypothetical protein